MLALRPDADGDRLEFQWFLYGEPSQYVRSLDLQDSASARAKLIVPPEANNNTLHFIAAVRDKGSPPLARYQRGRVQVE